MEPEIMNEVMQTQEKDCLDESVTDTAMDSSEQLNYSGYMSDFFSSPFIGKHKLARRTKDEFWDALSSNYDYLMDDGLIATCREASSDLSLDDDEEVAQMYCWSFTHFIEQFKSLHDMLHQLQVKMSEDQSEDLLEEQKKVILMCKHFNEQGQKLSKKYPEMRDEVLRHLNLLNNKWGAVEQSINPYKQPPAKDAVFNEITSQMRCLRRVLRELEERSFSVTMCRKWPLEVIEEKLIEQQALQQEIESKGKFINALLKLCDQLKGNFSFGQQSVLTWDAERVKKVANNLQNRWHSIWLKSLESHCILEEQKLKLEKPFQEKLERSFSEEPLKKYPRLSESTFKCVLPENERSDSMNFNFENDVFSTDHVIRKTNKLLQSFRKGSSNQQSSTADIRSFTNDKAVMVGNTGIAELKAKCNGDIGKFEIVQDVGYSSETSAHFSNDELPDVISKTFNDFNSKGASLTIAKSTTNFIECADVTTSSLPNSQNSSPRKILLAPDKYPTINLKRYLALSEDRPYENSKFNKSPPLSFYKMTSLDMELADTVSEPPSSPKRSDCAFDNSSQQIFSHQSINNVSSSPTSKHKQNVVTSNGPKFFSTPISNSPKSFSTPVSNSNSPTSTLKRGKYRLKSSSCDTLKGPPLSGEKSKRSARIREWLDNCNADDAVSDDETESKEENNCNLKRNIVDSSCDASGEYTTESDGEKSLASDDVNNSVSFSQSCTGSVETVVPILKEETIIQSDRAGSAERSPSVRMRKKKRHGRDRPWSVTELHQVAFQPATFTHSTSDGAIHKLCDSKEVSCSKKLCLNPNKSSLSDVSPSHYTILSPSNQEKTEAGSKSPVNESGSESGLSGKKEQSSEGSKLSDSLGETTLICGQIPLSNGSDHHSHSSCQSNSSKRRSQNKHKRRLKAEAKQKSLESEKKDSSKETKLSGACNSNQSCAEDQSSISDQVWDEYQDPPYLSEPYSEQTADEDQVKRLINFGDDYRAVLGSQSDSSSASAKGSSRKSQGKSQILKLENKNKVRNSGSDSDSEDFHNVLATSYRALQFVRNCLNENLAEDNFALSSEFADLVATCQTNLCHLHAIQDELVTKSDCQTFSSQDLKKLREIISQWEILQNLVMSLRKRKNDMCPTDLKTSIIEVENIMFSLKSKLNVIWSNASDALSTVTCSKQLDYNIQALQSGLATLQELKGAVLSVSARIRRLMAESGSDAVFPLRDDAAKLYQQWEDVYELSSSQLTKLQSLSSQFQESQMIDMKSEGFAMGIPSTKLADSSTESLETNHGQKSDGVQNITDTLFPLYPKGFEFSAKHSKDTKEDSKSVNAVQNISRFWRAFVATMPFQLVLIMAYCFSNLIEPKCCENMNNFEFSLFPRLRYFDGPPPT